MSETTLAPFSDPLMDLLHAEDLNREIELSNQLLAFIEEIPDVKIKQWCIDSLTCLRDLERIELKLHGWEFTTLDYRLNMEQSDVVKKDDAIKLQLSKRVLSISLELHDQLSNEAENILLSINRSKMLTPAQLISDSGTILTELVLRLTKLREQLHRDVSVGYSRAKLVIIGCELENMVINAQISIKESQLDTVMVNNYKQFVNTLLTQLEQSVTSGDTMSTMECIAIVNDVEKMFESMKQSRTPTPESSAEDKSFRKGRTSQRKRKHSKQSASTASLSSSVQTLVNDDFDYDSEGTLVSPSGSVSGIKRTHQRTTSNLRADTELARTTISDQLPSLLSAFKETPEVIKEEDEENEWDEGGSEDQDDNINDDDEREEEEGEQDNNEYGKKEVEEYMHGHKAEQTAENENSNNYHYKKVESEKENQPFGTNLEIKLNQQDNKVPTLVSSLFGSPLLHSFYQPQIKEPIYIPKHDTNKNLQGRIENQDNRELLVSTIADKNEISKEKELESKNVLQTIYKVSKYQGDALTNERRMKELQQIEQMRLLHSKTKRSDLLVSPEITSLREGRVRETVKEIEKPHASVLTQGNVSALLGGLSWPK